MIDFLSLSDVLLLHENQINLYGGKQGVRDLGLLESAINQPQATFGGKYLHSQPFGMAAAYFYHIVKNHPFIDGNKRTAVVSSDVFLIINGVHSNANEEELYELTIEVIADRATKEDIAQFYKANS